METQLPLTLGTEAEFLNITQNGVINSLAGTLLRPCDEVGVDGHLATIEIRTEPSNDAVSQWHAVARALRKYFFVLKQWGSTDVNTGIKIRGGSYYKTPLSIHIHFGNFSRMDRVNLTVDGLNKLVYDRFLKLVEDEQERADRIGFGYGRSGIDSIRIKGREWWEWRQSFSCLTPQHSLVLLVASEIVGRMALTKPDALMRLVKSTSSSSPPLDEIIRIAGPSLVSYDCGDIALLAHKLIELGVIDWSKDLSPLWVSSAADNNNNRME